jgi:hypothetical protein
MSQSPPHPLTMFRSYMNPTTRNWVFMEYNTDYGRWFPHAPTMRAWCDGAIRVYRPADNPATLITQPGGRQWPAMSPTECCYISTADIPASWISNTGIIDCIDEADIEGYDAMIDAPSLVPLSNLAGVLLAQIQRDGPTLVTLFEPITEYQTSTAGDGYTVHAARHPPPQTHAAHTSTAGDGYTVHAVHPIAASTAAALPAHVISLLIKEATGTPCPITMEPLTPKNAAVTACGHVFDRDGLQHWYATGHNTCPQCRRRNDTATTLAVANVTGQ